MRIFAANLEYAIQGNGYYVGLAKTLARNICIYNRRNGHVAFSMVSLH